MITVSNKGDVDILKLASELKLKNTKSLSLNDRMEKLATDMKQIQTHQIRKIFEIEGMRQLVGDLDSQINA